MGETFTIADIIIVHCLNWAAAARFEWSDPRLAAHARAARARPAFRRVMALAEPSPGRAE